MLDQRRDFLLRERLAELALDQQALGLFDDLRLAGVGDAHERAQRREVQLLLLGDDAQEERHGADVGDLSDGFEHRLAQRLLGVQREDRRQRGAVADLAERLDGVELQPEVVAPQDAQQRRKRGGVAVFAERGDDRRGQVDVLLAVEHLHEHVEALAAAEIAEEVDEGEADVDVGLGAEERDDRPDGRRADAHEPLGGGVALAGVVGVAERFEQSVDDLGLRIAHEAVDDGLAHAPVLVAEELEHQRVVALVLGVGDGPGGFLAGVGVR